MAAFSRSNPPAPTGRFAPARIALALASTLAAGCPNETIGTYNTNPEAHITLPAPGAQLESNTVTFAGSVQDAQTAPQDLSVEWFTSLDPDAPIFSGAPDTQGYTQFAASGLASGEHVVTLKVTDERGASDTDTISIHILTEPPAVLIEEPLSGYTYFAGTPIDFIGHVSNFDETEFALQVNWASDIQGELFNGFADGSGLTQFSANLEAGFHNIFLIATDSGGVTGQDSKAIEVSAYPVGQLDQDSDGFCPDGIDLDGDGQCDDTEVTGPNSQDCNDFNADVCPICPEICDGVPDNNCDGVEDPNDMDVDNDGYSDCMGDCDDNNPFANPGEEEVCDGFDTNCDSYTPPDEVDSDADGWFLCEDCDDNNSAVNPGVTEICDGFDNDCDGIEDNGYDMDGDGYSTCENDCNDLNSAVHPGAVEICNDLDDDCDGYVNEDQAGIYEAWETSANSPGYQLNDIGPELVFGSGSCSIGGFLELQPGSSSVGGVFSSPGDLWDIYEFDTGLTSNIAAWLAFISSGSGLPASCTTGSISWTAVQPISVNADIDGTNEFGSGTSGTITFNLDIIQLFDIEYRITVQPMAAWTNCNYTYTLNFLIP